MREGDIGCPGGTEKAKMSSSRETSPEWKLRMPDFSMSMGATSISSKKEP